MTMQSQSLNIRRYSIVWESPLKLLASKAILASQLWVATFAKKQISSFCKNSWLAIWALSILSLCSQRSSGEVGFSQKFFSRQELISVVFFNKSPSVTISVDLGHQSFIASLSVRCCQGVGLNRFLANQKPTSKPAKELPKLKPIYIFGRNFTQTEAKLLSTVRNSNTVYIVSYIFTVLKTRFFKESRCSHI